MTSGLQHLAAFIDVPICWLMAYKVQKKENTKII